MMPFSPFITKERSMKGQNYRDVLIILGILWMASPVHASTILSISGMVKKVKGDSVLIETQNGNLELKARQIQGAAQGFHVGDAVTLTVDTGVPSGSLQQPGEAAPGSDSAPPSEIMRD